MITLEELEKIIKKDDTSVDIPCCANCEHYHEHPESMIMTQGGKFIKEIPMDSRWTCSHPTFSDEEDELWTEPEDFCSRYERRK